VAKIFAGPASVPAWKQSFYYRFQSIEPAGGISKALIHKTQADGF
jgi:hypothetical protein